MQLKLEEVGFQTYLNIKSDFIKGYILPYGCIKKAHNDNLGMEVSFQSRELSSHISATGKKQRTN